MDKDNSQVSGVQVFEVLLVLLLLLISIVSGVFAFNGISNVISGDMLALGYAIPGCIFCVASVIINAICIYNIRKEAAA